MENHKTTEQLIEFAQVSMEQAGYSAEYIASFSGTWNALKRYLADKGIRHFTSVEGTVFLQDRYGIRSDGKYATLSQMDKRRKRAVLILHNCLEHETFLAPKSYSPCTFAPRFEEEFQRFIKLREEEGMSLSTLKRDIFCLNRFSQYLDAAHIPSLQELESVHIIGFMKHLSLAGTPSLLGEAASSLRLVLTHLFREGCLSRDLSLCVPQVKGRPEGIPSVYTKEEVQRLIEGVDRTSPTGKRNYAIILLAARLGMRASDICGLTFNNLNWQSNTIEFTVQKTGRPAVLPLLPEVGEAIIEYLQYGRPASADKHVFLRMQTPGGKMKPSALYGIVSAGIRNAHIPLLPGRRRGPHALRASLASAMLENHTPLPVIAEALTHAHSDTTRRYLKIDLTHLREYALDVPPLGNVWLGGGAR